MNDLAFMSTKFREPVLASSSSLEQGSVMVASLQILSVDVQ